tara:strand:- start:1361 stop:2158 length:798 start_codon:yes stop_codon:yes gene_type:complete
MNIGIVGIGVVGSAVKHGFEKLGHAVTAHDIKYETSIRDVRHTDVVYICVPTPSLMSGKCDVTIVTEIIRDLNSLEYKGIIAIKSTVEPGTTNRLQQLYPDMRIAFVPEFLRERCAISDFVEHHDLCVIGTSDTDIFECIKLSHGKYPRTVIQLSVTEAELVKYFNNIHNALLITFANSFYDICKKLDVNYTNVKDAVVNRSHITDIYLDCNENLRGFGGVCLPKDTKALNRLVIELETGSKLFETILSENERYKTTIFEGMRSI